MVALKLFSVLSAFLLIQVRCDVLSHADRIEDSFIDFAKAALKLLEDTVNSFTTISLETLKTLESTIKSTKKLVLRIAEFEVNELSDEIFQKLNEIKKGANVIVDDIINCTENREQDLKDLLVHFLNKTGDCAVEKVNTVLDSLETVVVDIRNVNEDVKNITTELEDCKKESNTTACIAEVIKTIQKEVSDIPAKVNKDVVEAEERVNELINYLFECEHDNINELEMVSQEIYNGIVECIEGNILQPNVILN